MIDVYQLLLYSVKHIPETIQFDSGAEHRTRQKQIRGKEEEEGRTHPETIPTDEGWSDRRKDNVQVVADEGSDITK